MQDVDKYTEIECDRCDGTGASYDPTNADKVFMRPDADQCPRCKGQGRRLVLTAGLNLEPFRPSSEPVGDMPDWMC
jgi:hypothetical protein